MLAALHRPLGDDEQRTGLAAAGRDRPGLRAVAPGMTTSPLFRLPPPSSPDQAEPDGQALDADQLAALHRARGDGVGGLLGGPRGVRAGPVGPGRRRETSPSPSFRAWRIAVPIDPSTDSDESLHPASGNACPAISNQTRLATKSGDREST
ncbi:hypothetical protein [Kitasatospora sp. NPDC058190]|uniref:hypothetical protein n=1 Tax=Kitasatospora sp. NPDC058190 TaxID=3346371 RepID=UPI0036DC3C18